jgi:hypothetical protein
VDTFQYLGACELTTLAISFDWVYELYILVASVLFLFFPFLSFEVNESSFPSTFSWIYIFGPIPTLLFTSSSSSFFFFSMGSLFLPPLLYGLNFLPIAAAGHCQFCHNAVSALYGLLHIFSRHKNSLLWSDNSSWWCKGMLLLSFLLHFFFFFFFLVYIMLNQYLFLNSIKQLVRDLLFAILNSLRITGFTPAVILLKGVALSLSLSLFACSRAGAHACA